MYRQIADHLRRQIEEGVLPPGAQLRTELELREKYAASRNTVRDAIKWLITRGLVETRPGQGTFVVEKIDPFVTPLSPTSDDLEVAFGPEGAAYGSEVMARLRRPETTVPRVEVQRAPAAVALELQLQGDMTVVSRHQLRLIDDTLWSMQTSFYPMSLVQRGAAQLLQAANIDEGAVKYLKASGIKLAGWRDKVKVRAPDKTETTAFRLPDDGRVAVVETRRTGYDTSGKPFVLTISVYPADRNEFVIDVGDVPAEPAVSKGRPLTAYGQTNISSRLSATSASRSRTCRPATLRTFWVIRSGAWIVSVKSGSSLRLARSRSSLWIPALTTAMIPALTPAMKTMIPAMTIAAMWSPTFRPTVRSAYPDLGLSSRYGWPGR
jgi:GntR family transcriptional regulator